MQVTNRERMENAEGYPALVRRGVKRSLLVAAAAVVTSALPAQTVFLEDWGNGLGGWNISRGVWQLGGPAGSPWIATVDGGAYPVHTDSRLTSVPIQLPGVSGDEVLWLWIDHWFQYSDGRDFGAVEVSVWDTETQTWGAWQRRGSHTLQSAVWSRKAIGLTDLAGNRIKLSFLHVSDGGNTYDGWYLRHIEVVRTIPALTFDFQGGFGDWFPHLGVWEIGGEEGSQFAITRADGNYPVHTDSRLTSAPFRLGTASAGEEIQLRFWHWFQYSDGRDGGYVQVISQDPETGAWSGWETLAGPFTLNSGVWSRNIVDLTAYAGRKIALGFLHTSDGGNTYSGWAIRELEITHFDPPTPCANGSCLVDCNDNGIDDATDIADGTSEDADGDGIPDECGGLEFRVRVESPTSEMGPTTEGLAEWVVPSATGQETAPVTVGVYLDSNRASGGPKGWSISLEAEPCFEPRSATTDGTVAAEASADPVGLRRGGFEKTEVVVPEKEGKAGRSGVVSAVILSYDEPVTLPPVSSSLVLFVEGDVASNGIVEPGDTATPCAVRPLGEGPWLAGSGQPVETLVSIDEESYRPEVTGARIVLVGTEGFVRGDANADGSINLTDSIAILSFLFLGGNAPACMDAADASDQGEVNITSAIYVLGWLFLGAEAPPVPTPSAAKYARGDCGPDPTDDALGCAVFPGCS